MTDTLRIKTNNIPRLILDWDQLTPKEQSEFDDLNEDQRIGRDFVRYRGAAYDLGDMMRIERDLCTPQMREGGFTLWHGYASDSYFSGVLARYCENNDYVVMATYFY